MTVAAINEPPEELARIGLNRAAYEAIQFLRDVMQNSARTMDERIKAAETLIKWSGHTTREGS